MKSTVIQWGLGNTCKVIHVYYSVTNNYSDQTVSLLSLHIYSTALFIKMSKGVKSVSKYGIWLKRWNYLGQVLTDDQICDAEIQKYVGIIEDAFPKLSKV